MNNKMITIPTPCHEDWNAMAPNDQGRHCLQCCKTVVDFTQKEPLEIALFLKEHASQKVCGRFTTAQLDEPLPETDELTVSILQSSLSYFKKIAAIIVVVFGLGMSSCNTDHQPKKEIKLIKKVEIDTLQPLQMGIMLMNVDTLYNIDSVPKKANNKKTKPVKCNTVVGDTVIVDTSRINTIMGGLG